MKRALIVLLAGLLLLSLCACTGPAQPLPSSPTSDNNEATGKPMPSKPEDAPTTGDTEPTEGTEPTACEHKFISTVTTEAGCTTDGVLTHCCDLCGYEETEVIPATNHNFQLGSCTACGDADPNFRELTSGSWELMGVTESEDNLVVVTLEFYEGGEGYISYRYCYLCSEEEAEEMLGWGATIYEVDGNLYCSSSYGDGRSFNYSIDNGDICCDLWDGFLYLNRETDDVLTVQDSTDFVMESEVTQVVKATAEFTCAHEQTSTLVQEATCKTPGVLECGCSVCHKVWNEEVPTTRHSYDNGICTVCNTEAPYSTFEDGEWVLEALSEDGNTLYVTTLTFWGGDFLPYSVIIQRFEAEEPEEAWDIVTYEYNGVTYYGESWSDMWMSADAYEEDGVTHLNITEKGFEEDVLIHVTLQRVSNNQFVVLEANWEHCFPVGAYIICY